MDCLESEINVIIIIKYIINSEIRGKGGAIQY